LVYIGSLTMDCGAYTPFLHAIREREKINDLLEELCGARLTFNYVRIGGVSFDITDELIGKIRRFLDAFESMVREIDQLISFNEIFMRRCVNVGVISREDALSYGLVGPNLRACGVDFDVRRDAPYSIYPELDFKICVGTGRYGRAGDTFERYYLRILEMLESVKILRQCLDKLPQGDISGNLPKKIKPEKGADAYVRVESSRGDLGVYIVSDGTENPYRLHMRTGSFNALSIMHHTAPGMMIADVVAFFASMDVIAPETDR
ncbi:MAG: NADH-quinone oxidoreductase subunit D, partial [Deltaproteobacteria bacterium]|nr:NADH-quinone oxidoreductase subunit D [Deltaproteobacteria bacterium]